VIELCSICLIDDVSCHNVFAVYLDSTSLGMGALLRGEIYPNIHTGLLFLKTSPLAVMSAEIMNYLRANIFN